MAPSIFNLMNLNRREGSCPIMAPSCHGPWKCRAMTSHGLWGGLDFASPGVLSLSPPPNIEPPQYPFNKSFILPKWVMVSVSCSQKLWRESLPKSPGNHSPLITLSGSSGILDFQPPSHLHRANLKHSPTESSTYDRSLVSPCSRINTNCPIKEAWC